MSSTPEARRAHRDRRMRKLNGLGPDDPVPILVITHPRGQFVCRIVHKRAWFTVEEALTALIIRQLRCVLEETPSFPIRIHRCQGGTVPADITRHYHLTSQAITVPCSATLRSPLFVTGMTFDEHEPVDL